MHSCAVNMLTYLMGPIMPPCLLTDMYLLQLRIKEWLCSLSPCTCVGNTIIGGHEAGLMFGIKAGYGTCYCFSEKCFCEKDDIEGESDISTEV